MEWTEGTVERTRSRRLLSLAVALLVLAIVAVALVPLLSIALGGGAPAWSHWWCSPAALRSASHAGGGFAGRLLALLKYHWPHVLPIVPGVATLEYLRRANARYESDSRANARYESSASARYASSSSAG
jgi:hypothetical protein